MRHLFSTVKALYQKHQKTKALKQLFKDVAELSQSQLLIQDIELFLDVELSDFDENFINDHYKEYVYLFNKLNILALISYIDFINKMKEYLIKTITKKTIYPGILILTAIITLFIFRNSLMILLSDFTNYTLMIIIEIIYDLTIFLLLTLTSAFILVLLILRRKDYFLMSYRYISKLRIFRLVEIYHLKIITKLLLIAHEDGLSTQETFLLMNSFKGETLVSNIAYFVTSDLKEGHGLGQSIENMRLSQKFKKLLKFAIASENYHHFIASYYKQLDYELNREINKISKRIYFIAYVYIFVLVLLFYKILSLPMSMISSI